MGEFKAQILAILLVLGVFGLLNSKYRSFFDDIWKKIEDQIVENID